MKHYKVYETPPCLKDRLRYMIVCDNVGEIGGYRISKSQDYSPLQVFYDGKWRDCGTKNLRQDICWRGNVDFDKHPDFKTNGERIGGNGAKDLIKTPNVIGEERYSAFIADQRILSAGNLYSNILAVESEHERRTNAYIEGMLSNIPSFSVAYKWLRVSGCAVIPFEFSTEKTLYGVQQIYVDALGDKFHRLTSWNIPDVDNGDFVQPLLKAHQAQIKIDSVD